MILEFFYKNYIPKTFKENTSEYFSAKNLIGAAIICFIAAPVYSLLYYALHHHTAAYFILSELFFGYLAILTLKHFHSVVAGSAIIIGSLVFLLFWLTYSMGGIYASSAFWLILPPLAATFISGIRNGMIWAIVSIMCTSILFSLEYTGVELPQSPITAPLVLQFISLCGLTLITLFLAYFYEQEKKRALKRLHYLAYHDPLTHLPNRTFFKKKLEASILETRHENKPLALLFLDFDNFKTINDTLGHTVGDLLLKEAARRIRQCLQPIDLASRIGGDEFNILLTSCSNMNDIEVRAVAILTALRSPFMLGKHEANVTASIGISVAPMNSSNYFLLNRYADLALYQAKNKGGNNFHFFTKKLAQKEFLRVEIERKLPYAVINNELYLNFQPIFDANNPTKIVSIESLLRWKNKELGIVPPKIFIPIAERIGMISHISNWTLRETCRQYVHWLQMGLVNTAISIQVNISVQQVNKESFANNIKKIVNSTGIPHTNLILELTETEMFLDLKRAIDMLQKVNQIGITLAIDDFGTGYTSLRYLNALPINIIKIDKSFIKNMHQPNNARIISGLINLGHSLKLKIIAEGIETMEQLNFLNSVHCDYLQGYLLSKPLACKKMQALLVVNKTQDIITQPKTSG